MSDAPEEIIEDGETGNEAPEVANPENALTQVEQAARTGGWVPKDEWKGDPDKWVDAAGFVLKAAEILPHVTKELKEVRAEVKATKRTLADFADHHSKTEQRAYQRALSDIQARIDQAAAMGDVQGVREGTDELVELRKEAETKPPAKEPEGDHPEFAAFKDDNAWYGKDKALSAAFDALCKDVFEDGYTTPKSGLKEALSRLRSEFPQKFENPARRQAAPVEGAGAPPRKAGKGYADLPPDAKAMCDDFVKRIPGFKREQYIKDFFA